MSGSGRTSAAAIATSIVEALAREAVPERRKHAEDGYAPSALEILGVPAPALRRILGPLGSSLRAEAPERVLEVARALLETRVHESRQIAYELVGKRKDVVRGLDRLTVEELGAGNDNWASVDAFGVYVAGPAWRDGKVTDADVRAWAHSADRWWRRTALVVTVALNVPSRGGSGDAPRTLSICEILADDPEPMVAKAQSWALRALVAVDATAVRAFLDRRADELPALVKREVRNKLETGLKSGRKR